MYLPQYSATLVYDPLGEIRTVSERPQYEARSYVVYCKKR